MDAKRKDKKKINCRKSRIITKSPVTLAKFALEEADKAIPRYSNLKSRKDFTQSQIFAILVLKAFFKTDYRGIIELLRELSDLREALGLKKIPHYSTLCYAEERVLKKTPSELFKDPSWIDPRIWVLLRTQELDSQAS
jgi:hypothetical protein